MEASLFTSSPVIQPDYHTGRTAPNKGQTYPAEILTPNEVKVLIRACSNNAPAGMRNRALITVLYRGGLRLAEALALKPKDMDPELSAGRSGPELSGSGWAGWR